MIAGELLPGDDVIELDELRLRCVIGINCAERHDSQDVVVDYAAPWVGVHKPGALRFADSVGVAIHRRPGDFRGSSQPPNVAALALDREHGQ
ncbi:MAG: hypothetical protein ACREQL_00470 [Candidatus Binatia bacterium]